MLLGVLLKICSQSVSPGAIHDVTWSPVLVFPRIPFHCTPELDKDPGGKPFDAHLDSTYEDSRSPETAF